MRTILTGDDIDLAYQSGKKEIHIQPNDIITSIAKEKAEKHGIRFIAHEGIHPAQPKPPLEMSKPPAGKPGKFIPPYLLQPREGLLGPGTRPVPPYDMDYWRKQFPLLKTHIHVANCSQAPQSTFTRQAALEYLDNWDRMGMDWDRWMEEVHFAKEEFAKIINADPNDVAIGTSVSEMTSAVASALPLNAGRKKVVATDAELADAHVGRGPVVGDVQDVRPELPDDAGDGVQAPGGGVDGDGGGDGLIAGIAAAASSLSPETEIIGVQADAALTAVRSFKEGHVIPHDPGATIADGIAVGRVGDLPFEIMKAHVTDILSVPDEEIAVAILLFLERKKLVVEGAGAVPLAALLRWGRRFAGRRVDLVLSGGNIDFTLIDRTSTL